MAISSEDRRALNLILTPSWLSALLAVTAGLFITIGVIVAFSIHTSSIQQQLLAWQQSKPVRSLTTPDQVLEENDKPTLAGSWPLIVIWSVIGLVTYVVAAAIVKSVGNALAMRESYGYADQARKKALLHELAEHIVLRFIATITTVILIIIFCKRIVPYCITAAHASAGDLTSGSGITYALLAFVVSTLSIHVLTIFFRLTIGRPRVF